jgi:hypothetical protein
MNVAFGYGAEGFSDGKACALPYAAARAGEVTLA